MHWIIIIIAVAAVILGSGLGKIAFVAGAIAIGLFLLSWLFDIGFLAILAKVGIAVIIVIVVYVVIRFFADF